MRATDIIRGVLDLIDDIDCHNKQSELADEKIQTGVDSNRFKHIFDLLSKDHEQMYNNSPVEKTADIAAVTVDAGGGWNGPKNPADMRSNSVSLFPGFQAENKE
jgi:hypothetical protein